MFSNIKIAGIVLVVTVLVGMLIGIRWQSNRNDALQERIVELEAQKVGLEETIKKTVQWAKDSERAAQEAVEGQKRLEAALTKATEDKNKIQKKWSSLYQQYTEAMKNDPETNDWDSSVLPAGAVGVLLQAGGIRAAGSD